MKRTRPDIILPLPLFDLAPWSVRRKTLQMHSEMSAELSLSLTCSILSMREMCRDSPTRRENQNLSTSSSFSPRPRGLLWCGTDLHLPAKETCTMVDSQSDLTHREQKPRSTWSGNLQRGKSERAPKTELCTSERIYIQISWTIRKRSYF